VFDPKDVTFAQFRALVAFTCYHRDLAPTSWMQNPLLVAWYSAACLCPSPCVSPSCLTKHSPSIFQTRFHPVHYRFFATSHGPCSPASSGIKSLVLPRAVDNACFGDIATKLLIASTATDRLYDWCPIHHVYNHPFIPFLVPSQCKAWLKEFLWHDYLALTYTFPVYMEDACPTTPIASDDSAFRTNSPGQEKNSAQGTGSSLDAIILSDFLAQHDLQPSPFGTAPGPAGQTSLSSSSR
jgi:hypothetical protein